MEAKEEFWDDLYREYLLELDEFNNRHLWADAEYDEHEYER